MSNSLKIQSVVWMSLASLLLSGPGFCPVAGASVPVAINEFLASNKTVLADPQGQFDDWIEFYNTGSTAVDVAGLYVTDDLGNPTKWRFPSGHPELTTIASHGYLLLWADGQTADTGLHANFNLSSGGEEIGLYDRDGVTRIDSIVFGRQTVDVSYGRYPDGADNWEFMAWPTPGEKNVHTYAGAVEDPLFSQDRGFCDAPFTLTLTTPTDGATIYYTLDGSDPLVNTGRGLGGVKYTEPPLDYAHDVCPRGGH